MSLFRSRQSGRSRFTRYLAAPGHPGDDTNGESGDAKDDDDRQSFAVFLSDRRQREEEAADDAWLSPSENSVIAALEPDRVTDVESLRKAAGLPLLDFADALRSLMDRRLILHEDDVVRLRDHGGGEPAGLR